MYELIKVDYSNDQPVVSARELHKFLEVGSEYSHWFKRMCEYGFTEGQDFTSFLTESTGGRRAQDSAMTIDMAKEICMLQRNDKGKQARQYFIQLEKDWNSPEKVMARALRIADQKIKSLEEVNVKLEEENTKLETENETMKPKALFADAVGSSESTILVGDLAKLLCQNGVNTGQNRLFDWLRINGYLCSRHGESWNMPKQRYVEMGLFKIKESFVAHKDGHTSINKTVLITGKGQQYFINLFLADKQQSLF